MSYQTNDPILLAALQGTDTTIPDGAKVKRSSQYRGVSKNRNAITTTWSASTGCGGKEYNLGTYCTEEEAALARNYGDELVRHPRPVNNIIADDAMPDLIKREKVARTVVALLRKKGVCLSAPSANVGHAGSGAGDLGPAEEKPAADEKPAAGPTSEEAELAGAETKLQQLLRNQ